MRDEKRIDNVLNELAIIWKKVPDWRFFQLLQNIGFTPDKDFFYLEDDDFLKILKETNEKIKT